MKYPFYKKTLLPAMALMVLCNLAVAQPFLPSSIVVIKDELTKLTKSEQLDRMLKSHKIELNVYDINAIDHFEDKINKLLPGDELKAKEALEEYISRTGRAAFEQEAIQAYQGLMAVVRYELEKYPAIIFDEKSVIYGVTDLDDAMNRYSAWRTAQGGTK
jgi:integrating conjugative element protein (TIGR03757 family)